MKNKKLKLPADYQNIGIEEAQNITGGSNRKYPTVDIQKWLTKILKKK